ncbi:hypothetical protein ABE073_04670 [Lederbergia citrisecunda]|uniref:hypothetical protein n=1 Tax=Lederbergia citrisecunda TaxID=2833583 RepID=UPI003D2C59B6
MKRELEYSPTEVEKLVFKEEGDTSNNYIHVSIEEMDYMVEYAKKYEQLHNSWFECIDNKDDILFFLRKCKEIIEDFKPEKINKRQ